MLEHKTEKSPKMQPLSPWNPLDYARLLKWALIVPQRLIRYRETYGEQAARKLGKWLTSTAVWLPPLIPTLALGLGQLPNLSENLSSSFYLASSVALALLWILTGWLDKPSSRPALSTLSGYATTGIVMSILVGSLVGAVASIAMAVVAMTIEHLLAKGIENNLKTGSPSKLTQGVFIVLLLVHVFLIWFSFLGGWRAFV